MEEEQLKKLPIWAQNEFNALTANIELYKRQLAEINGELDTNTFMSEGLNERPLPKDSHINFRVGYNNVSVYIMKDGTININTDSRTGHEVVILPRASNSFYLKFVKDK